MRTLTARAEEWPLVREFRISRASKSSARVVVVTLELDDVLARGECLPYPRYDESPDSVLAQIEAARQSIEDGCSREELLALMPAGAARNAVDAALIDLESKAGNRRAWDLLGEPEPEATITAYTLSMDSPEEMASQAAEHRARRLLKLKLGPKDAAACVRAVRDVAPHSDLIVDANEAWTIQQLESALPAFVECDVALIEQPLPAGADDDLRGLGSPIPIGADESCHTSEDLAALAERYQVVNVKLDKTGGLTEAVRLKRRARENGMDIMVGCMIATSLSMAPAMILTPGARFVDLDGPLLLLEDRSPGLEFRDDLVFPPEASLWG
ncbi:MAG: dipeptide epimerase [Proteobacteria bacterium]|nr:MAG: dipeptide epimerase [Pseudomonadota bacterium]